MKKIKSIILCLALLVCGISEASDRWTITADSSCEKYYGVMVGNGGIGIVPFNKPFSIKKAVINHVFDADGTDGVSKAVSGFNPMAITASIDGTPVDETSATEFSQTLDMRHAVHSTTFTVAGKAQIKYDIRALRQLAYAGMTVVEVKALDNIHLELAADITAGKNFVDLVKEKSMRPVNEGNTLFLHCKSRTKRRGVPVCGAAAFINGDKDATVVSVDIPEGKTFRTALVGAVCTTNDFIDPFNEAIREVQFAAIQGIDEAIACHERLWDELWQGDIEIEGDDDAQTAVRLALYHLYSSCREGSRLSIPPFGLSDTGYNGHVFWDTEIWMYPPMLFLNGGIAKSMMDYRADRLPGARKKAMAYGYKGAMYPWESDFAGEEACPTFAHTGLFEQHITADVAIAAWNYYRMTGDIDWLRDSGWPLLRESAIFWVSRVTPNADGSFSIRDVIGADEMAGIITDNAYTNGAAICALQAATKAAKVLGYSAPAEWDTVASHIRILRAKNGMTLEFEGYDGQEIKQADVNLLAYPLQVITDEKTIRKDLKFYQDVIAETGPAMSYSILALEYSRLGDGRKAYEMFRKSYEPNMLPPFGVLSECSFEHNPYFTTGAGGLLQAVINGFCGLELTDQGIVQLPSALPPHWKSLTVKGVGPERKTYSR